jgi:hypothetical protein
MIHQKKYNCTRVFNATIKLANGQTIEKGTFCNAYHMGYPSNAKSIDDCLFSIDGNFNLKRSHINIYTDPYHTCKKKVKNPLG